MTRFPDVRVTTMLNLAKHIVNSKSDELQPDKFEDHHETALVELINQKRAGKPIAPKERPRGENVIQRRSVGGLLQSLRLRRSRQEEVVAGQKEMLMPIAGKAKEGTAKKPSARQHRKSARHQSRRARMDMEEASAMTEASGLTDEQYGVERASGARRRQR